MMHLTRRHRSRTMLAVVALAGFLAIGAAAPSDTVDTLERQGYFIESGASASDTCVSRSVSDARASGGNLYIVVLAAEPAGGATTYAGATLTELGVDGTVLVVAPETLGWESQGDIWATDQLNDAIDSALDESSDDAAVSTFVESLTGAEVECSTTGGTSSGGGGGWILLLGIAVVIAGIVFLVMRSSKKSAQSRRESIVGSVEAQIADIANDILDLEGEIRGSGNADAIEHFETATKDFSTASDRLEAAQTPVDLMDLSYDLDVTIWHLDAAEAILDGNDVPDRPERPKPPPPAPRPSAQAPETPASGTDTTRTRPGALPDALPEYQRRSTRSSSYASQDVLKAMLAMQAMKGFGTGRRSNRPPSRGSSGGGSRRRTRGGGRRRG